MVQQALVKAVQELSVDITIQQACDALEVSTSSYYRWKKELKEESPQQELEKQIGKLCRANKFRYGYRKITALLRREKIVNHKAVQRIMQKNNWQCRARMKKRNRIGQPHFVAANHLNRNFQAKRPLERLITDITYLPFGQKMLYLSSILDVYNGEIIAFTISDHQNVSLVLDTLSQLPELSGNCILHSDQGSVYTSAAYQSEIKKRGITMSMSRKGTPADNAPIESFHSTLKSETFYLDEITQTTTAIVKRVVQNYIQYYNKDRIQTKLNSQSPIDYRQLTA